MELKRFNRHWSVSKNKTIEIEGYNSKKLGFEIFPRLLSNGYDHPGFLIEISFWYTLSFMFHDNRHWADIIEEQDRARVKKKDRYKDTQ